MNSVIISDYGVMLAKKGERLVIRGPKPRLELIEGGPQLFLPLGLNSKHRTLTVVTSEGPKASPPPLRRSAPDATGVKPPKKSHEEIELPLFRVGEIVIGSSGVSLSTDLVEACCERGIRLSFLTRSGKPYAMLSSPMLTATVITRRKQINRIQRFARRRDRQGNRAREDRQPGLAAQVFWQVPEAIESLHLC
jgi:CRISPR associated protein, Cas1 family